MGFNDAAKAYTRGTTERADGLERGSPAFKEQGDKERQGMEPLRFSGSLSQIRDRLFQAVTNLLDPDLTAVISENAVMADFDETFGQDVQKEAPDEFLQL